MTLRWSEDWTPFDEASPYVHWWKLTRPVPQPPGGRTDMLVSGPASSRLTDGTGRGLDTSWLDDENPIPAFALNARFREHLDEVGHWLPDEADLPAIPDDTVIVGVIDTGIALGHNRFRDEHGKSRILAAWQNTAEWGGPVGKEQPFLPYGREIYTDGIEELLRAHSGGSLDGWLDEDAFNRACGVLDMARALGHREVAGRHAHGTHVLDAAAGADPADPAEAEFRRRAKIIAVNLPGSATFGESGTFLDSFMIFAIRRISDLADAIWRKNHPVSVPGRREGYPVVINLSFGKQAGSKTTLDVFAATLKAFREEREANGLMPVHFVMPVGNDNLARCNAYLKPMASPDGSAMPESLNWRVQPEDQSANYVEIWSECFSHGDEFADGRVEVPLGIAVVPPGGGEPQVSPGLPGHVRLLLPEGAEPGARPAAAIYFQVVQDELAPGACRFRYVIAAAPTLMQLGDGPESPAGLWRILLGNGTPKEILCIASIQTDQSILPGRSIGLRSYFDDPTYRVFDVDGEMEEVEAGRAVESYDYPDKAGARPVNTDLIGGSRVRRHGTMNASAAHSAVARVGGYRTSDGRPAPYSATGRGRWQGQDDGTDVAEPEDENRARAPTASLPTDDGPAHFGILGAGAANGSTVAMRGTSFASAQATRCVVREILAGADPKLSANWLLFGIAHPKFDNHGPDRRAPYAGTGDIEALGGGRIACPLRKPVSRTGER